MSPRVGSWTIEKSSLSMPLWTRETETNWSSFSEMRVRSDFEAWHAEDGMPNMHAVSASLILTDNHEFNGPLMLIPGSHMEFVPCQGESPEDNHKRSLKAQEVGVPSPEALTHLVD